MRKDKGLKVVLGLFLAMCGGMITIVVLTIRDSQTGHSRPFGNGDVSFDLSPSGKEIVFSVPVEQGMDIYLYDLVAEKASRLLTSDKYEWAPRFSSDGSKVVFAGGVPGERGDHIFVFDRKSGKIEQLTQGLDNDTWPSFYDRDRKIVFTRETEYRWGGLSSSWNDSGTVHSLDIASREVKLVYDRSKSIRSPEILPSGLLFVNDFNTIRLVDLKSKKERIIVKGCRDARLSVDEKTVVFTDGGIKDDYVIHYRSVEDKRAKGLIKWDQNPCSNPIISPDGKTIYFIGEPFRLEVGHQRTLNRIDRDGKNLVELIDYDDIERATNSR